MNMYEVSKEDWKLFREKLPEWQERYMEKLNKEYMDILNAPGDASDKFWKLEKRIKKDKTSPGVQIQMKKSDVVIDLVQMLNEGIITDDDISCFGEDVHSAINFLLHR